MRLKSFETERLLMRLASEQDAEFVFRLFNTPKWILYIGDRNISSVEKAKEYIKEKMSPPPLGKFANATYTLIKKEDNQKIGTCGLYDREGLEGIDIGFALLPEFEKMGFAFEASNKLKEVAFNELEIETISAITLKDNTSSQKLLKKLGLTLIGTIKLPHDDQELLLFKIGK